MQQLAAYAVGCNMVREWLTRFEQGGVAALAEGNRSGRPPKLDAAAQKIVAWVGSCCQQVRHLGPWRLQK